VIADVETLLRSALAEAAVHVAVVAVEDAVSVHIGIDAVRNAVTIDIARLGISAWGGNGGEQGHRESGQAFRP
jgi:hypothetical protein